ncbi:MAG: universal stress protein [Planctomycetota bacterium]
MLRFQKIMVPTDFSAASKQAFLYARELAKLHGAEVLVVHVVEVPHYPTLFEGTAMVVPPLDETVRRELTGQLDRLIESEFTAQGVSARRLLRDGSPRHELLACARDEQADLLVIATHGYTGLRHVFLGSTTEQVVREAPCPVLTVRARPEGPA